MPYIKPSHKILVAGDPLVEECVAENTGASDDLKPGMLVIKGTADHQVKYAGAAAVNVDGVADFDPRYPISDLFPEGSPVRVLKGACVVVVTLKSGESVNKGDRLVCAASGEVKAAAAIAVTVPSGGTAVTSDAAQPDLTESGSTPPGGVIVAVAEETVDASGGAKSIMVRLI